MTDNGQAYEIPENERPKDESVDIAAEFAELGRKLHDAINAAWGSEERQRIQKDLQDGLDRFAREMNQTAHTLRESELGQRVGEGARQVRADVESGKVSEDVRKGLIKTLRGLSEALDRMADSFTPAEGDRSSKK